MNCFDSVFKEPKRKSFETVIASAAKQSMAAAKRKLDCFVATLLAMTASPHTASRSRRHAPELCI
jgi:hypothetical protein